MSKYDDDHAKLIKLNVHDYLNQTGPLPEFLEDVFDALMKYEMAMQSYYAKAKAEQAEREGKDLQA